MSHHCGHNWLWFTIVPEDGFSNQAHVSRSDCEFRMICRLAVEKHLAPESVTGHVGTWISFAHETLQPLNEKSGGLPHGTLGYLTSCFQLMESWKLISAMLEEIYGNVHVKGTGYFHNSSQAMGLNMAWSVELVHTPWTFHVDFGLTFTNAMNESQQPWITTLLVRSCTFKLAFSSHGHGYHHTWSKNRAQML